MDLGRKEEQGVVAVPQQSGHKLWRVLAQPWPEGKNNAANTLFNDSVTSGLYYKSLRYKLKIVIYASVCSKAYNHNLQSKLILDIVNYDLNHSFIVLAL